MDHITFFMTECQAYLNDCYVGSSPEVSELRTVIELPPEYVRHIISPHESFIEDLKLLGRNSDPLGLDT